MNNEIISQKNLEIVRKEVSQWPKWKRDACNIPNKNEQEIERMAVELAKINCKSAGCENCDCAYVYGTKLASCEDYVQYYQMATKLVNVGYGNTKQICKNTAKEILQKVRAHYPARDYAAITLDDCYMLDVLDDIAKQYGIEVD